MRTLLCKALTVVTHSLILVVGLSVIPCYAQTQAQPDTQTKLVGQRGISSGESDVNVNNSAPSAIRRWHSTRRCY